MQSVYEPYDNKIGVRLCYVLKENRKPAGECSPEKRRSIRIHEDSVEVVTYSAYEKQAARKKGLKLREGRGPGNDVLLSWDNMPYEWQQKLIEKFGDPKSTAKPNLIERYYTRDPKAMDFYANEFVLEDGRTLDGKYIQEYITNASVLNAIITAQAKITANRKALAGTVNGIWGIIMEDTEAIRSKIKHTLKIPSLKNTLAKYKRDGYSAIINGRFCNDNRQKVTALIERMLLSLYAMPNKPFSVGVHELYKQFLAGEIEVVDKQTGELFNREDFKKKGEYVEISEATVWNYINNPLNRALVDKSRLDILNYNTTHRPYARRHAPNFSFSKISMDDRDLPRKIIGGDRVKAYYAYDVASGAVIGKAFSRNKDEALFIDCLRDMFRLMNTNSWGVPQEVEVENHLVSKFFEDLEVMFPILRICAPGNSPEKHAEHLNKAKKYGTEKKTQIGIGRWWAKSEAYRTKSNKVDNEYKEKLYSYEQLVSDDLQAIKDFNNSLHPKKNKYPGMTRWQVLCANLNPDLKLPNKAVWMKSIGNKTRSSIKRSEYVTVQYNEYRLPAPQIIARLKPNNYNVDAYYLPNEDGIINEVFIYQDGEYICRCEKSETFNTAKSEWTEVDEDAFEAQASYTAKYDKMIREGREQKIGKAVIIPKKSLDNALTAVADSVPDPVPKPAFNLNSALLKWGGQEVADRAIDDI